MKSEIYAIAEIAGDQVVLVPGEKVAVPKIDLEVGKELEVDRVLYLRKEEDVQIGTPYLKDVRIKTVVSAHKRNDKVTVFKKKRRKGYQVKKGHRQPYTELEIVGLAEAKKRAAPKKTKATPSPQKTTAKKKKE